MIINRKNRIYRRPDNVGVLLDPYIKDNYIYYNRYKNELIIDFGLFHIIEGEEILVSTFVLNINDNNKKIGIVEKVDPKTEEDINIPIEEYYAENGSLDGAIVIDYGVPSVELAKSFFTGGNLEDSEIQPANGLAKEWLLNTIVFDGKPIKENFEFTNQQ